MWAGDGQYRCLSVHALCLTSAVSPVFSLNSFIAVPFGVSNWRLDAWNQKLERSILCLYICICVYMYTCIYVHVRIYLYFFHQQPFIVISWRGEQDQAIGAVCEWEHCVFCLCWSLLLAVCICIVCVSVYTYVRVLIGNTCSALLWAGPGDMELYGSLTSFLLPDLAAPNRPHSYSLRILDSPGAQSHCLILLSFGLSLILQ